MTTPHATPDDGRPSVADRVRLADELQDQLASSRLAWEAALLRSDAALAAGDAADVRSALDDHRELLGALEARLGAVVAAATVARDAEGRTDDRDPAPCPADPTAAEDEVGETTAGPPRHTPRGAVRRGATALLGAAAAILVVAGSLVGDLTVEPHRLVAGSVTDSDPDVRTRSASLRVVAPDERTILGSDRHRRAHALPPFSGDIPRTAVTAEDGPRSAAAEGPGRSAVADVPARRGADGTSTTRAPATDAPEPGDQRPRLPVGEPAPDEPSRAPIGPLPEPDAEPDADPDVTSGTDVRSTLPQPSGDLEDTLGTSSSLPAASDPTSGLG